MSRLLRKRKKKGRLSILSHREFYAWKGRMKSRDESIFDSFRFPLRGILSEGKASPSDLISTRHDCARYCRYINLKDDQGGHESRSSLDRPTLCPEDVERLVSSGVSIEEVPKENVAGRYLFQPLSIDSFELSRDRVQKGREKIPFCFYRRIRV